VALNVTDSTGAFRNQFTEWDISSSECHAEYIGTSRRFGTTYQCHLQGSSKWTNRLSRNVGNYQYTLRDILEEGRSHLHRCGSLKSRIVYWMLSYQKGLLTIQAYFFQEWDHASWPTKRPGKDCAVYDISVVGVVRISRVNIDKVLKASSGPQFWNWKPRRHKRLLFRAN